MRRRLSWLAAGWLCCQIAGFVAAPAAFGAIAFARADDDCGCPGRAPGQACPMHSHEAEKGNDSNTCRLRNACAPDDAVLLSLAGGVGVLTQPLISSVERIAISIDSVIVNPLARTELPESPPPRA